MRIQTLINNLFEHSRVQTLGRPFETVNVADVLDAAKANLVLTLQEKNASIEHGDLPVVEGDRMQLEQLFQNLIGNAIKFHGEEAPKVRIEVARQSGEWIFRVSDNGIGIEAKYLDHIFDVFQRLHTRSEYPGTGIVLAICQRIVQRHGGRIWGDSDVGQGATYSFTIPDRKPATNSTSAANSA